MSVSLQPSVCRMVMAVGGVAASNGADVAPAMITRVWGDAPDPDGSWTVNMTVFPDASAPCFATSVHLFHDERQARASLPAPSAIAAFWPPRVGP